MSQLSNYVENALINHVLRNVALSSPVTVYVALYTSDPTDADTGTEVVGGGYARQAITFNAPVDGVATNSADVVFPTATANWGTISHFGIRDAATGGNLLWYGPFAVAKPIYTGDTYKIPAGQLSCSLA
ncbi:MAG: hypothetical protein AB1510_02125 [Bacillota bacterium]